MDSSSFVTANGLPVMFENVPSDALLFGGRVKANTIVFSDNVFFNVK